MYIFILDTDGTQLLIKGGWLKILKNIYQDNVRELLLQNSNLTNKSEFHFAIYTTSNIPLRKIKANFAIFKEVCAELNL